MRRSPRTGEGRSPPLSWMERSSDLSSGQEWGERPSASRLDSGRRSLELPRSFSVACGNTVCQNPCTWPTVARAVSEARHMKEGKRRSCPLGRKESTPKLLSGTLFPTLSSSIGPFRPFGPDVCDPDHIDCAMLCHARRVFRLHGQAMDRAQIDAAAADDTSQPVDAPGLFFSPDTYGT